jgi:hypothetical protein
MFYLWINQAPGRGVYWNQRTRTWTGDATLATLFGSRLAAQALADSLGETTPARILVIRTTQWKGPVLTDQPAPGETRTD